MPITHCHHAAFCLPTPPSDGVTRPCLLLRVFRMLRAVMTGLEDFALASTRNLASPIHNVIRMVLLCMWSNCGSRVTDEHLVVSKQETRDTPEVPLALRWMGKIPELHRIAKTSNQRWL